MKRSLYSALALLAFAGTALAQMPFYVNDGVVQSPPSPAPQIDCLNFVNNNTFTIIDTNFAINSQLWDTSDTVNFTNTGIMTGAPGFQFDTAPSYNGYRQRAGSIFNSGTINVGSTTNIIFGFVNGVAISANLPKFFCNATNILNPGSILMGFESLCTLAGENVDMSRGTLNMGQVGVDVYNLNTFFNGGFFAGYWGLGYNTNINPARYNALNATTPGHLVTNRQYFVSSQVLGSVNQSTYVNDTFTTPNNREVLAVYLSNTNRNLGVRVFFPGIVGLADIVVEWSSQFTNADQTVTTNYLYLFDGFGYNLADDPFNSQFGLVIHDYPSVNPAYIPINYLGPFAINGQFVNGNGGFFPWPTPLPLGAETPAGPIPPGTFPSINVTNQFAAYQGLFVPSSAVPSDLAGGNVTNLPGRIELKADKYMNLSHAHIASLNYLKISSPNHFAGSDHAKISSPYCDIDLRSTNGFLLITNLLSPTLAHPEGVIDCYSGRFTNIVGTVTNSYHVLFLDTILSPEAPSRVQNLTLRSTNMTGLQDDSVLICDVLNVLSNSFTIDTTRLTFGTNAPNSPTAYGGINLLSDSIVWSTATPRLEYLTNWGSIRTLNAVFFGGSRTAPYFSSTFNEPYEAFVNHGGVTNFGSLIWSKYFENNGFFWSQNGNISLQNNLSALMTNGTFWAPGNSGAIELDSAGLFISNHVLLASGPLTLAITNTLDDGSLTTGLADAITNKNVWSVSGLNFLYPTASGSLLGTTISNLALSYADVVNRSALPDRGSSSAGFTSGSGIGHLILKGFDPDSHFTFQGVTGNNAIYVDLLEFQGSVATNIDLAKNYLGVGFNGMKIYYGNAIANGISIAERLNGKNGGGFNWVSSYNTGFFSSTNMVYPDGSTNRLNLALVRSCDIDSNGNGIPNCTDPAPVPILSPGTLNLSVALVKQPGLAAAVTWQAFPGTTNYLYSAPITGGTNWQLVTNFVYTGPVPGPVTVTDLIKTNAPRFYRVRVSSPR